jgi:hypothetical protein
MIEVLKEFLLFGVIEIFILLSFYKYVGKLDKVKYWHELILSQLFFIMGLIQFPFAKQIGMIVVMIAYLYVISEKVNIKIVAFSFIYLLAIEMIICMLLDITIGFDFTILTSVEKFIIMIPIRILEILLILLYNRRLKHGLDMDVRIG